LVYQRRFAMVNVRDNGDVANIALSDHNGNGEKLKDRRLRRSGSRKIIRIYNKKRPEFRLGTFNSLR
jgi:hypothetical protein